MTNKEWVELIKKEFNVSGSEAKEMLHVMLSVYKTLKDVKERINSSAHK